jgi:hypothetical protein
VIDFASVRIERSKPVTAARFMAACLLSAWPIQGDPRDQLRENGALRRSVISIFNVAMEKRRHDCFRTNIWLSALSPGIFPHPG